MGSGFTFGRKLHGDKWLPALVFTCNDCGTEHYSVVTGNLNPEHMAKRAERDGWSADHRRASRNRCPVCKEKRAALAGGEKPEKEPTMATDKVVREPTAQERVKIRNALDEHFDDGAGCYLNGQSDQKIGHELNIPWAIVAKIREAAYGPIRVDPEVAALRAELVGLAAAIERVTKQQQEAVARLAALEKKRSAA